MMGLTAQQSRTLRFIRTYAAERGCSPSLAEIAAELGVVSKGGPHRILAALEERGAIRRFPRRARSIEIINDTDTLAKVSDAALLAEVERRGLST